MVKKKKRKNKRERKSGTNTNWWRDSTVSTDWTMGWFYISKKKKKYPAHNGAKKQEQENVNVLSWKEREREREVGLSIHHLVWYYVVVLHHTDKIRVHATPYPSTCVCLPHSKQRREVCHLEVGELLPSCLYTLEQFVIPFFFKE